MLPRLGSLKLRELTPSLITGFRLELEAEGVGRVSIHRSMTLLQGVLRRACEWDGSRPTRRAPSASRPPRGATRSRRSPQVIRRHDVHQIARNVPSLTARALSRFFEEAGVRELAQ